MISTSAKTMNVMSSSSGTSANRRRMMNAPTGCCSTRPPAPPYLFLMNTPSMLDRHELRCEARRGELVLYQWRHPLIGRNATEHDELEADAVGKPRGGEHALRLRGVVLVDPRQRRVVAGGALREELLSDAGLPAE